MKMKQNFLGPLLTLKFKVKCVGFLDISAYQANLNWCILIIHLELLHLSPWLRSIHDH